MQSPIIKRAQVQPARSGASAAAPDAPAAPPARCTVPKRASLIEAGGRPVAIEVTCSCGETTIVELEFPAGRPATPAEERKSP